MLQPKCELSSCCRCSAAHKGALRTVQELLADGHDVDEQDQFGRTALGPSCPNANAL